MEETAGFQREGDAVVGGLEGTGPVRLGSDFKSSGGERIGADAGELEISKNVGGIVVVANWVQLMGMRNPLIIRASRKAIMMREEREWV